jgi:outer membrane protein TolC
MRASITLSLLILPSLAVAAEPLRIDATDAARLAVAASALSTAADARVEAALSAIEAADARRLPVVTAGVAVGQQSAVPEFSAPLDGPGQPLVTLYPNIETTGQADLSVSQPVYAGGGITAAREAARHQRGAAEQSRRITVADLRFAGRTAYWQAVAAAAAVDAATASEVRAARLLDDARALRAAGMAVDADVYAAEARLAAARVELIRSETAARQSLASLRSLLAVTDEVEFADGRGDRVPPPPATLSELQAEALSARPELAAVEARMAALESQARATEAVLRPSVAVSGQWLLARPNQRYFPLEDEFNDSWRVAVLASWQLFDGQRTRSQAATLRGEGAAVAAERQELRRRISLEVETARLEVEAALEAVTATDAAQAAAAAREEASRERYGAGMAPIWEMLDAQADLAAAELEQIRSRATAWLADAALDRAVGR